MTNNKKILIIDDEYRIREVTKMILEMMAGWTVLAVGSGSEGVSVARSHKLDAILLDVMMPDIDGMETLARLKADPKTKDIPVLLLTGKSNYQEMNKLNNGVQGWIEKPFTPLQLAKIISDALGWD